MRSNTAMDNDTFHYTLRVPSGCTGQPLYNLRLLPACR